MVSRQIDKDLEFEELLNIYLEENEADKPEPTIALHCTHCHYEEDMPKWCYNETVDMMRSYGDFDVPCFECPNCGHEKLYPKDLLQRYFK